MKARLAVAERIHSIWDEHVQMDVEIQSRSEALNEGDRTAASTTSAGQPGFSDPSSLEGVCCRAGVRDRERKVPIGE